MMDGKSDGGAMSRFLLPYSPSLLSFPTLFPDSLSLPSCQPVKLPPLLSSFLPNGALLAAAQRCHRNLPFPTGYPAWVRWYGT